MTALPMTPSWHAEAVKAVVQVVEGVGAGPELAAELLAYCRAELAAYKCPHSVDFTGELPREPSGKLYKRLCASATGRGTTRWSSDGQVGGESYLRAP